MQREWDVDEEAYDTGDGEDAYEGMDAYVGGEGLGFDVDDSDGEYVPEAEHTGGRRGVDDDDDYEDADEDPDEDEDEDADLDLQLDAEDAMETINEFQAAQSGRTTVAQLLQNIVASESAGRDAAASVGGDGSASGLTIDQFSRILALFRSAGAAISVSTPPATNISRVGNDDSEEGEDDDELEVGMADPRTPRSRRQQDRLNAKTWWKKPHKEPQAAGVELLMSGEFGRVGPKMRSRGLRGYGGGTRSLPRLLRARRMSTARMPKEDLCEPLVPNSHGTVVASYPANVYCGQFSADSSFYYVCCKDFNLHLYDMTAPRLQGRQPNLVHYDNISGHRTTMKVLKSVRGISEGWTITDSHLSPDNERMIYSSMNSTVYMINTLDFATRQTPINFSDGRQSSGRLWGWDDDSYCIWSCRFSADGNEVIAGGRGKIFVYDLLADRRTVKIAAHDDDVNSCCWADTGSNVLISASDDTFIKVWDRRSLGSSRRPSGVLIGHTEGITNVSAKGDGRYVISNGKDQALRLWDLRKMRSNDEYEGVKNKSYGLSGFDYRYADDRTQRRPAHPQDCSVMTYRGHTVMRTLIRCHFSPAESTGGSYIYSGSTDGRIHIWSLDGQVVQVLDRSKSLPISFDPSGPELAETHKRRRVLDCVRDVSWHSKEPVMLSAAWGGNGQSTVARHEWKGLSKMNGRLEDWVEKNASEAQERQSINERTSRRRSVRLMTRLPGAFSDDDDEENI